MFIIDVLMAKISIQIKATRQRIAALLLGYPKEEEYSFKENEYSIEVYYLCPKFSSMALKCGIVGLPNVGKSTLFNCLSNAKAQSANFPFCTIEPNVGTISVPDSRLEKLESLVNPERVVPTTMEIVDIAGLVKGASKGEGLGNQFLANIRETDAIIHVVRCFEDDNIIHVDGKINPVYDKEVIDIELQLKDLETIEKKITSLARVIKSGDKDSVKENELAHKLKVVLEAGKSARSMEMDEKELEIVKGFQLITAKPVLYLCNVDEASVKTGNAHVEALKASVAEENAEVMVIGAKIEADITELEDYEERQMFLEELGLEEPGVNRLIRRAYDLLNLQTYFTAGVKEVRAWTITKGMTAPQAAGVIHTDFEKGFIRAEVMKFEDFTTLGSEAAVKEAGKFKVEGKGYVVSDGDVMHFLFNV
jgi:GTP-binding protein YchF